MPFSLLNALLTFQGVMNELFISFLMRFVLVFFNKILIYNKQFRDHKTDLGVVLELLKDHKVVVNLKKYTFGQRMIDNLGYIVSTEGVNEDPKKVQAMRE